MLHKRNVVPFDFVESTNAHVAGTLIGENSHDARIGIYIDNKWTAQIVTVPLKEDWSETVVPAQPDLFRLDAWIKEPASPPNLYWTRVTKQCANYIVHYMLATTNPFSSAFLTTRIEYIGGILMLKIEDDMVVSVTDADITDAMDFIDRLI